ncbi:MAG TPA: hypothetical protein VD993_20685 [Chitinophagaceae bacterium]|nr:hypothetical protein [Chitinophagaceae bacterium]
MFEHDLFYYFKAFIFLILVSFAAFVIAEKLMKGKWKALYVAPAIAAALTLLTVFFLQGHSVLFKEESSVLANLHAFKQKLGVGSAPADFIDSNFILVNTSRNPELVPDNHGTNYEDSARQVITNRGMLTAFLEFANRTDSLVDLVVCDIVFTDPGPADSALFAALEKLQHKNKLVLAYNKQLATSYHSFYAALDPACFGEVSKVKNETFYFSHELLNEENIPSLPYSMYLKLNDMRAPVIKRKYLWEDGYLVARNFIPEFNYIDEEALYRTPAPGGDAPTLKLRADTQFYNSLPATVYSLGHVAAADGQQQLLDLMSIKNAKHKNIVFIANFGDAYADRHATAYGNLYGTTLLLNEFYVINRGYHRMSVFLFVMYIFTLFLLYSELTWWLLTKKTEAAMHNGKKEHVARHGFIKKWFWEMVDFVSEERHYILLFVIALVVDLLFNKIINVMGLLYFFLLFSAMLNFFMGRHRSTVNR